MSALLILLCLVVFFIWLYFILQPSKKLKEYGDLFPGPQPYPVLGNLPAVGTNSKHMLYNLWKIADRYGPTFRLFLGKDLYIFLSKPEDIETVVMESKQVSKSINSMIAGKPWLGEGLITAPVTKWKANRKRLLPAFHTKSLESFIPIFDKNAKLLVEEFSSFVGGPEIDINKSSSLFSLRNIRETAMGVSLDSISNDNRYPETIEKLTAFFSKKHFNPLLANKFIYNLHPLGWNERKLLKYIDSITEKVIHSRKEDNRRWEISGTQDANFGEGQNKRLIFLDLLLKIQREDPSFSDQQIRDEVNSFMFAGHDTVAATIAFCLYLLSKNRDIQNKIYEECQRVLGETDRPLEFKDVQEIKYLEQVIKETLRIYTTIPMTPREAVSDIKLKSGLVIPAGAEILLWFHRMHHDPDIYSSPEVFNPDNFSPENIKKRQPHSFLPFGEGPRDCIGMKFAFIELKVVLCHLIRNFIFLPSSDQGDLFLRTEVVLKTDSGIHLKIKQRQKRIPVK